MGSSTRAGPRVAPDASRWRRIGGEGGAAAGGRCVVRHGTTCWIATEHDVRSALEGISLVLGDEDRRLPWQARSCQAVIERNNSLGAVRVSSAVGFAPAAGPRGAWDEFSASAAGWPWFSGDRAEADAAEGSPRDAAQGAAARNARWRRRGSFTVINAAVGYGKTTLVRSWCIERPEAVIWVTLDSADDDPVRLWTHLATAVERLGEGFGRRALSCLGARGAPVESRSMS